MSPYQIELNNDLQCLIEDGFDLCIGERPDWLTPELRKILSRFVVTWRDPDEWLTLRGVPYFDTGSIHYKMQPLELLYGSIAMPLSLEDGVTVEPTEHWALWNGQMPRSAEKRAKDHLFAPTPINSPSLNDANRLAVDHVFVLSSDPRKVGGYLDHEDKVQAYISYIVPDPETENLDPTVTATVREFRNQT